MLKVTGVVVPLSALDRSLEQDFFRTPLKETLSEKQEEPEGFSVAGKIVMACPDNKKSVTHHSCRMMSCLY